MADNLSVAARSRTMSLIRSKNTVPEVALRRELHARGLRYRIHDPKLPGKPDVVFARAMVAVFIDGDYWHGWRFPVWCANLPPYWQEKIALNRRRDRKNRRKLRRLGWLVVRVWEHQIKSDLQWCADCIQAALEHPVPDRFK